MKKKSIKKNYIYNLSYQILIIILPIITTPYLARILGANGTGIYGYTISIVTYFILFGSLGLNLYGQREIAYIQDDKEKRSKIFSELVILKTITMLISIILFYIFFGIKGEYSLYYKILLLEMVANIIDISWLYQGLEEFKKIVIRNFIIKLISLAAIFLFIKSKDDVGIYILIYVLTTLIGNISLWFNLKKYVKFIFRKLNIVQHVKPTLALFVPQIAIQVYTILDKTMIGAILGDMNEVGYYEQAQKIIKILLTIITSLGTVMMPRIANCFANNNQAKINDYMKKSINFVYLFSFPLMFGIIAVSSNFVPLFFGVGYDSVILIMIVMSFIILFISLSSIIGTQYLLTTKRQKEFTTSVVMGAIINFLLNFILIKSYKSLGATFATVIAEFTVTSCQIYFVRKQFNIKDILKLSKNYFISALVMLIICFGVDQIVTNNFMGLILQVIIGIISYFVCLVVFRDKFIKEIINKSLKKYIKKIKLFKS